MQQSSRLSSHSPLLRPQLSVGRAAGVGGFCIRRILRQDA